MHINRALLRLVCGAFLLSMLLALPAFAACTGEGTTDVDCNSDDTDGAAGSAGDDVITIDENVTVSDSDNPTAQGVVTGTSDTVDVVNNNGAIEANNSGQASGVFADEAVIVNGDGTIEANGGNGGFGIVNFSGNVTINDDPTITATGNNAATGVQGAQDITITGDAEITATSNVNNGASVIGVQSIAGDVEIDGDAVITVSAPTSVSTATGIAAGDNVYLDGDVTITVSAASTAIGVAGNEVILVGDSVIDVSSSGSTATGVSASELLVNFGTVIASSDVAGIGVMGVGNEVTVLNFGSVSGDTFGVVTVGGESAVVNFEGGSIHGGVSLNDSDDVMLVFGGEIDGTMDGGEGAETEGDFLVFSFTVGAETNDEMEDLRAALDSINPNGGTITLNGHTYTWTNFEEFVDLVELIRVNHPDGDAEVTVTVDVTRINYPDVAAPMTGYCVAGGITLYQIVGAEGVGTGFVSLADVQAAVAEFVFAPVFLGGNASASLYLTSATTLELRGVGYAYSFPVGYCG